jgi:hypothetical protein
MAEATVIAERIYANVLETLRTINTGAGYSHNAAVEELQPAFGNPAKDGLAVVRIDSLGRTDGEEEQSQSSTQWLLELTVISEAIGDNVQARLLRQWADIYRCLCAGYGRRVEDGVELAVSTFIGQAEFELSHDSSSGMVAIPFTVRFETASHDPLNQ